MHDKEKTVGEQEISCLSTRLMLIIEFARLNFLFLVYKIILAHSKIKLSTRIIFALISVNTIMQLKSGNYIASHSRHAFNVIKCD